MDDTPFRIAELHSGLKSGTVPSFVRAAHSIKGSSSNVGACELRAIAEYLEQQARNHGLANLDGSVAELEVAFDRARAELKKLIST
jgi:histidine phosphotransfer protein HptB